MAKVKTYTLTLSERTCERIEEAFGLVRDIGNFMESGRPFLSKFDLAYEEFDAELWRARNPEETQ